MSTRQLLVFGISAAVVAAVGVAVFLRIKPGVDRDRADGSSESEDHSEGDNASDSDCDSKGDNGSADDLSVIDTSFVLSPLTRQATSKKRRKKRSKMKAGFLNNLGAGGIESPIIKGKKRAATIISGPAAEPSSSPAELEDRVIAEFISVSKQMQDISTVQQGSSPLRLSSSPQLSALQRRRMSLVASLQQIRGPISVARLESRLADLTPPPPPPEPTELFRQSIAHRIMTDPNFTIDNEKATGLELEVQKTVRRAYWDAVRSKLSVGDPPTVAAVLADLFSQVIAGILSLREESPKFQQQMATVISSKIDLGFLKDQASRGLLTMDTFSAVVRELTTIIGQCQSPERDAARESWLATMVASFQACTDEVASTIGDAEDVHLVQTMRLVEIVEPTFDGLFEMVETTKRDLLNYQIKMMRAHLTQNGKGIEYQRQKFQARLDAGEITLENTRTFLARGLEVAETLPGLAGKGSKMIDREEVKNGNASACRHLLAVSITDYVYSNSTRAAAAAAAASATVNVAPFTDCTTTTASTKKITSPRLPETLDVESSALEKVQEEIFGLVEATACILKTNQFAMTVFKNGGGPLSNTEKSTLYEFFRNHSRELDQHESVKEVEVPIAVDARSSAAAVSDGSSTVDGSDTRTKKMLLVTRMDPNGKKLRRVRLEAGAIFASKLLGNRGGKSGEKPTPEQIEKLEQLFLQLENDPSTEPVFRAATMILRNATLRAIQSALAAKGNVDAEELVQATAGKSPLGLPDPALCDFGKVLQGVLQLVARNFEIFMDSYKKIVMVAEVGLL